MKVEKIISLEEDTCCHRAVLHMIESFGLNPEIMFVKSFQEAKELLIQTNSSETIMLVPHLNDIAKELTFAKHFDWDKSLLFSIPNPRLFLVKKTGRDVLHENTCATLPVLQNLVDNTKFSFIDTNNTQESARFVADKKTSYGITNESGLQKYKLEPIEELKAMEVVWFSFRYNQRTSRG